MISFPKDLSEKLIARKESSSFRELSSDKDLIDFSSNDYLGFARNLEIKKKAEGILSQEVFVNGSTGSRLVSGSHTLHESVERNLADFFNSEAALLFNSGYDANVGLFSSILQKGNTILYDELIHASIRDGIRLSNAKSYKFKHNSLQDLKNKFDRCSGTVYIVVESIYSMDGDSAPLYELVEFSKENNCYLIVDEAHSSGVFGDLGKGMLAELNLENDAFARVHTFGKAMGCHGAVVFGSRELKDYLINFSRSFIYTTAASLHSIATIQASVEMLKTTNSIVDLNKNIEFFKLKIKEKNLQDIFIKSDSAVQCCLFSGNTNVKFIAEKLKAEGFSVKAILSPTVPLGEERLRICLHSDNTFEDIERLLKHLANFAFD
jgi:8-amino-7-oxononanoate synthase